MSSYMSVATHDTTAQHVGGTNEQEERNHQQHAGPTRAEEDQERLRRSSDNAVELEPDSNREPALQLLAVAMRVAAEETEPEPYITSSDSSQTEYFTPKPSPTERASEPAATGSLLHQEDSTAADLQDEGMELEMQTPAAQAVQISHPLESEPSAAAADADSEYDADRSSLSSSEHSFALVENDNVRCPRHWQWISDAAIDRGLPPGPDTTAAALPPTPLEASQEIAAGPAALPHSTLEVSLETETEAEIKGERDTAADEIPTTAGDGGPPSPSPQHKQCQRDSDGHMKNHSPSLLVPCAVDAANEQENSLLPRPRQHKGTTATFPSDLSSLSKQLLAAGSAAPLDSSTHSLVARRPSSPRHQHLAPATASPSMSASASAAAATDTDTDADHQQREIQIQSPAQTQIQIGVATMLSPEQDTTAVTSRDDLTEEQVRTLIMEDDDFDPIPVEYRAGFGEPSDMVENTGDATAQEEEQEQEHPQQIEPAPPSPSKTPAAADQQGLQRSPWNNPLHRQQLVDAANNAASEQGSPSCAGIPARRTPARPAQSGPHLQNSPAVVGYASPAQMPNMGSPYAYGPMPLPSLPGYNVPSPQAHVPVPVPVPGYGFVPQQGPFTAPIPGFGFDNLIGAGPVAGAGHGFIVGSPNANLHGYFPPHPQPYPPPNLAFLNLSPGRHGVGVGVGHGQGHGPRPSQPFVSPVRTPGSGRARHRRGRSMNSILSAAASPRGAAQPQLQPVSFGGFVSPYTAPVITAANMNMSPAAARAGRFNFDNVPRQPRAHMATRSQNIRRPPPQLRNDNNDKSADKKDKKA
ncbi:hypothetical protein ABEF95_014978 [Exophiala dermatitidis]